jgi:UDP-glucose 4-epimerase
MKILVTGGAGFIGSHVVTRYLDLGYDVVVVDDLSTGRLSNLDPRANFYQMDIQDPQLREIFFREQPEVVNHHAAQMNVRRSVADPLFDAQVNVVGSLNLIECAKEFGARRFVYISTGGAVYGEPEYLPCDENHPINPICPYGASKHTVEHYLYMYHENYGLESIVLRYPNVYGPRQDPNGEAGVIAIFTGLMLAGKPVTINGDGEQTRDYVYVGDCARANVLALETSIEHGIFNIGSGEGTSVNIIFGHLSELTDFHSAAHNGPAKVGETRHIYLDATWATERLGWRPEVTLAEGLAKTVVYFRESESLTPVTVQQLSTGEVTSKEELVERHAVNVNHREREPSTSSDGRSPVHSTDGEETRQKIRWIEQALFGKSLHTVPLAEILKATMASTGGVGGSILILDDEGHITNAVIAFNDDIQETSHHSLETTLEKGLAGWVSRRSKPALVYDTSSDPRWFRTAWEKTAIKARSAISVPLVESQRVRGVLTLTHPQKGKFTEDDLALLLTASSLLAINSEILYAN